MFDDSQYAHAECKCGRQIRALKEDLLKGMACPSCGILVKLTAAFFEQAKTDSPKQAPYDEKSEQKNQQDPGSSDQDENTKKEEENPKEELPQQTSRQKNAQQQPAPTPPKENEPIYDKCPTCSFNIKIEFRKKYLAWCPVCNRMFVRSRKPDPDTPEKMLESELQKEKLEDASSRTENKNTSENITNSEPGNKTENQDAKEARSNKIISEKAVVEKAPAPLRPTPKQIQLLEAMGIAGMPETSNEVSDIIMTVNRIAEDAVREYNVSFHLFPNDMKLSAIFKIIKSPYFPGIYFGDRPIKYEELQPMLEETIKEPELIRALKVYINDQNFSTAMDYISGFCDCIFETPIDKDILRIVTLKSFNRGFGLRLQPLANLLYDRNAEIKDIAPDKSKINMRVLYRKKNLINSQLEGLLNEHGFKRKEKDEIITGGCLIYFVLMPLLAVSSFKAGDCIFRTLF